MYCSKCGKEVAKNAKFCSYCSTPIRKEGDKKIIPVWLKLKALLMSFSLSVQGMIVVSLIAIISVIIFLFIHLSLLGWMIALIIFIGCFFFQWKMVGNDLNKMIIFSVIPIIATMTVITTMGNSESKVNDDNTNTKSSVVSKGVNLDDLGNIVNGQFYFDDGTNQFYSTFDEVGVSHIYVTNKQTGYTKAIFDGFGWSFVMHDGWLYFSGNQGVKIDATYNLFRMKSDGSSLEHLNYSYCYNMNFYQQWLYYIKASSSKSNDPSVYRSLIDGTGEILVISGTSGLSVIYEDKLYYSDQSGYLYKANPDGTNKVQLITEKTAYFIIGQGKIIFVDENNNIKTANVDGTNIKLIKAGDSDEILSINSYQDTIFYIKYNPNYLSDRRAYGYSIYTIKTNGTNDRQIYEGVSWGYYANVLNNKVYVLDYAQDLSINKFIAITRYMNLDGSNVTNLYRK